MQIIRIPAWGFEWLAAEYWGRRHAFHIGPFVILWGQMTAEEIFAWDERARKLHMTLTPPRGEHQPTHHKSAPQEGKV